MRVRFNFSIYKMLNHQPEAIPTLREPSLALLFVLALILFLNPPLCLQMPIALLVPVILNSDERRQLAQPGIFLLEYLVLQEGFRI